MKVCGDNRDIINKKPTGSVRISLGAMTTIDDVLAFIIFAKKHFIETIPPVGKSMYGQDWILADASFGSALNKKG